MNKNEKQKRQNMQKKKGRPNAATGCAAQAPYATLSSI
jgi:hypothetical protein